MNFIPSNALKTQGDKKKGFQYAVSSFEEYEELQNRISTILDDILENLKMEEVKKLEEVVKVKQLHSKLKASSKAAQSAEVAENQETHPEK